MADTQNKAKLCLDESRLLVLGAQILLGFQYRAFMEHDFNSLPLLSQKLRLISLALMMGTILALLWPITFHQIVANGALTPRLLGFATRAITVALFPFAVALGLDVYTVTQKVGGYKIGILAGSGSTLAALVVWYGLEYGVRWVESKKKKAAPDTKQKATPLHEKIDTVLMECRVVIPGSTALLGFQLSAVLMEGFGRLPLTSRYVHLGNLLMIALSTVFLMAPVVYHHLVERGEETIRLWRFARTMLVAAMVALAAGLAGEFFIVCRQVTHTIAASAWCAGSILAAFNALWFGYTGYQRLRQ